MPTEALPHLILGKIAAAEHRFAEAESELSQALNLEPASAEAIFALGGVRFSVDDYGGAIALFEKALQLAPDSHQGHSLLGTAYQYADRHSDAVREHKRAFELKRSLANFGLLCYAYYLKHRLLVLAVSILAALASIITAYPPPGMAVLVFILLLGLVNFAYGSRSRGLAIWLLALGLVALYILSRAWRMP
jgi:tetratricopeptide (TPR) repeat protein